MSKASIQSHSWRSNFQPNTQWGRGGSTKNLPIDSAIFHVLGVLLTSCKCTVKSQKKGWFHKLPSENGLWRYLTFCAAYNGYFLRFLNEKLQMKKGSLIHLGKAVEWGVLRFPDQPVLVHVIIYYKFYDKFKKKFSVILPVHEELKIQRQTGQVSCRNLDQYKSYSLVFMVKILHSSLVLNCQKFRCRWGLLQLIRTCRPTFPL